MQSKAVPPWRCGPLYVGSDVDHWLTKISLLSGPIPLDPTEADLCPLQQALEATGYQKDLPPNFTAEDEVEYWRAKIAGLSAPTPGGVFEADPNRPDENSRDLGNTEEWQRRVAELSKPVDGSEPPPPVGPPPGCTGDEEVVFWFKKVKELSAKTKKLISKAREEEAGGSSSSKALPADSTSAVQITCEGLQKGDAVVTQAIMQAFEQNADFAMLAGREGEQILRSEEEETAKLQAAIQAAIDRQVLAAKPDVEPVAKIDGTKDPDAVADEIVKALGEAPAKGCAVTLQASPGVRTAATAERLLQKLPQAQMWSSDDIFLSLTLLAKKDAEEKGVRLEEVLTPELVKSYIDMLQLDQLDGGRFDLKIQGLGFDTRVEEVQGTLLENVRADVGTVSGAVQGEALIFSQEALAKLCATGATVLVEGREASLKYIRTAHRFELVLSDPSALGRQEAALRLQAAAKAKLNTLGANTNDEAVQALMGEVLAELCGKPPPTPAAPAPSETSTPENAQGGHPSSLS